MEGTYLRLRRVLIAVVALVLLAGAAIGVVTGAFGAWAQTGLEATGLYSSGGASTLVPSAFGSASGTPSPTPSAGPSSSSTSAPGEPSPVLAAATPASGVSASAVTKLINAVDRKGVGDAFSGTVLDIGTGKVLYAHKATAPFIPASNMKLLTTTAALSLLGPDHRFTTKVVSPAKGSIVLVGGGDPYLASKPGLGKASVPVLANSTAAALKKQGVRRVSARVRRRPVHRSGLEPDLAGLLRRPGQQGVGALGRRGAGHRVLAGTDGSPTRRRPPQPPSRRP